MMQERIVPHIACKDLSKKFGTSTVLNNLTLQVAKGEFVSLIGPSGCGKSTLLKLVSGLAPVSGGLISVDGMTPQNARELMSFIFQDATLLPWRTVERNVVLGLELDGVARDRQKAKAEELLKLVGLAHVAQSYPRQLSGGMKMRVSIARALASRPHVLLMDEPFGALDEMTRDRMNEELLRIREEQKWTALFVTHSVAEAVFLSTRILILRAHPQPEQESIAHDIPIGLPWPRTAETRESAAFEATVTQVSRALREGAQQ